MRWSTYSLCVAASSLLQIAAGEAHGHDAAHGDAAHGDAAHSEMGVKPSMCDTGVMQSPLALHTCVKEVEHDGHGEMYNMPAERPLMKFTYGFDRATAERICEAKGCYVKLTPGSEIGFVPENSWVVPGDPTHTFQLEYCLVRMPSEHTVNGQHYPLEVQCVHYQDGTDKKKKGILSVLYENGMTSYEEEENKETYSGFLGQLDNKIPNGTSATDVVKPFGFDPADSQARDTTRYWNYAGSHTVGDCAEDAEWYVLYDPRGISQAQLKSLNDSFSQGWLPPRPAQHPYGRHPHGCMHNPIPEDAASPTALGALSLALALFSAVARA